jgi:hypothetical protein
MARIHSRTNNSFWKLVVILLAAIVLFSLIGWFKARSTTTTTTTERFSTTGARRRGAPKTRRERFDEEKSSQLKQMQLQNQHQPVAAGGGARNTGSGVSSPEPLEPNNNEQYLPVSDKPTGAKNASDAFPADRLSPDDLLPKDAANSKWAQANPAGQGDVKDQNFLTAGYHTGFNTQGSSMRNASYDLRSTPANPRFTVSIWQQSTIEPDMSRRPLE